MGDLFRQIKYFIFYFANIEFIIDNEGFEKCCAECGTIYTNIQYKWCKPCQTNHLKNNFVNWTSGDKTIDHFIQETQLKIDPTDLVFEWIPYDQFNDVEKIGEDNFAAVYLAKWEDGPLIWNSVKYTRDSSKAITLIRIYNSQIMVDDFLNKVKKYRSHNKFEICGITQKPHTKDYVIISSNYKYSNVHCLKCDEIYKVKWCKPCQIKLLNDYINSGNKKIDNHIQEMQLKINLPTDLVFEWIPYVQFNIVKKEREDNFASVYSAKWEDGPLIWNPIKYYTRDSNKIITLIHINNSPIMIDDFLNKVLNF
ncbi:hypothetical protein RirG_174750 [Rhizophagus irregularis DAOM 197198w]|uniref:Protein kinase domain-containing protein n=1 Tax=Rhizophagus irregularis (strain DAOM 197198w) TaxID=1432141 RepID=A0A015J2K0_RHIIW|nr:hypothetical protein RirG_174750 [Rhizophagus irregularis DAOM 197198w]